MISVTINGTQEFDLIVTDNQGKEHSSPVEANGSITMGIDRERTFRVVPKEPASGGSPANGD